MLEKSYFHCVNISIQTASLSCIPVM